MGGVAEKLLGAIVHQIHSIAWTILAEVKILTEVWKDRSNRKNGAILCIDRLCIIYKREKMPLLFRVSVMET